MGLVQLHVPTLADVHEFVTALAGYVPVDAADHDQGANPFLRVVEHWACARHEAVEDRSVIGRVVRRRQRACGHARDVGRDLCDRGRVGDHGIRNSVDHRRFNGNRALWIEQRRERISFGAGLEPHARDAHGHAGRRVDRSGLKIEHGYRVRPPRMVKRHGANSSPRG